MATDVWIAVAVGATIAALALLLLLIHWVVGRSVRGEVGANTLPILELSKHVTLLVDQAREIQRELETRLDEASQAQRAFDEALDQIRSQTNQRSSEFSEFAAAREAEIQQAADQAHAQIVQTLDVMNWTESEAAKLVEELRCLQEEILLEQQIRRELSEIAADHSRLTGGARLRFGRITTDSPFLDFVVKAEEVSPRYLSIQFKALGDRHPAERLQREAERAAGIQSAMPADLLTSIVVVNRLPNGDSDLSERLAEMSEAGVDVVPLDEFCVYARDWAGAGDSS